ncbi:peptidase family M1-domain-containing protein [Gorgonomyces haynaldii]|nr:peptidase family M1-domain-containing protein [Gorgonomyces haynaldii]
MKQGPRPKTRFHWRFLLAGLLIVFMTLRLPRMQSKQSEDWSDLRLPPFVVPTHYKIDFSLVGFAFSGNVQVDLELKEPSSFLVVHNSEMTVHFDRLVGSDVVLDRVEHRPESEYSVFFFKQTLPKGNYQLQLSYNSTLSPSMEGFYVSKYKKEDGTLAFLATTQFEPVYARKAFPCFDEPDKKATFDITISTEKHLHAISNMPLQRLEEGDLNQHVFERTVRMSTYLIAFVVSDFEHISKKTDNGILVSVYTAPGQTKLGQYALDCGVGVLQFYQKAFGIDFPLPKLDMIAVPDFAAGAMENWGLVTYRDTALLYDPKQSTAINKERVAEVIAHELAHQWFGNLVTMKWWNDLWLNEGFAEFMEYKGVNAIQPEWNMLDTFIPSDLVRALRADESDFTHPIALPVKDPNEINQIFDDISYGKGASVIRMLEFWMDDKYGQGTFLNKIHGYLEAHKYGNAQTADLWEALRTPDQDVGAFMSAWTNQPGFPLVTLESVSREGFTVSQSRFRFATLVSQLENNQVWSIPLTYSIYSNSTGKPQKIGRGFAELSTKGSVTLKFAESVPEGSVLLLNYLQTSVYRTLYPENIYRLLTEWLQQDQGFLPAVERAGLYSDVFSMCFSGHIEDPTICMNLAALLRLETNVFVWEAALKDLETMKDIFALTPTYGLIQEFQAELLDAVVKSIGWKEGKNPSHGRAKLRARLLQEAIRVRHPETTQKALAYFQLIKAGKQVDLSPDVYGAVYDAGVIHGDLDDYEWVVGKYLESNFAPEQQLLLHALASSPVPYLQARTLEFAIGGQVRQQDVIGLIQNVVDLTPVGHISTWLFFLDNWEKLVSGENGKTFGKFNNLLKAVTGSFTKPYLIAEAERLFVRKEDPNFFVPPHADVSVKKGLETAKQLLAWRQKHGQAVSEWLEENRFI